jgi:hypothetical protein
MTHSRFIHKTATYDISKNGYHQPFGRNARLARASLATEPDPDSTTTYDDVLRLAQCHLESHDNRIKQALFGLGHQNIQLLDHYLLFTQPIFEHKYGAKTLATLRRDCQNTDVEPLPELPEEMQGLFPVSPACVI